MLCIGIAVAVVLLGVESLVVSGDVSAGLGAIATDLREISHGIHPAILSRGGLGPGVKALAGRSSLPAELDIDIDGRLPEHVEVAAYYVVAEALTNAAKHAQASVASVTATRGNSELRLVIGDDGISGASSRADRGSSD